MEKETKHYLKKLLKKIRNSLLSPSEPEKFSENYLVFYVNEFDKKMKAKELLSEENKKALAGLLRFDRKELSAEELEEVFEDKASYYDDDLLVIDLNACFVFDSIEPTDIIDVIEYAKLQLLELRYYDADLDEKIEKAYKEIKKHKGLFANYENSLKILWDIEQKRNILSGVPVSNQLSLFACACWSTGRRQWLVFSNSKEIE